MATTIEQQVALDEALVPSAQRLRIGRSNFRLPSDIQSKESTLQVEFWATAYVHQHFIRFKMDTIKNIVDLESFREMLHISPRVPGQSFAELPFEEEILEFLKFFRHSAQIKTLTEVNVVSRHQNTQQYCAILPIELTTEDIRNTKAYKEYYACATREAAPNPKASARRKRGGSVSSTTPSTPIATPTPITTVQGGSSTDEGTGSKPGVPDVPSDDSEEEISWNSSDDEDVNNQTKDRD
nr:hypothetical protein [Tanacetum cinerariifolium]